MRESRKAAKPQRRGRATDKSEEFSREGRRISVETSGVSEITSRRGRGRVRESRKAAKEGMSD